MTSLVCGVPSVHPSVSGENKDGRMAISELVFVARELSLAHVSISGGQWGALPTVAPGTSLRMEEEAWKRIEFGCRAWLGFLGKQSRKRRLSCHSFAREGEPGSGREGKRGGACRAGGKPVGHSVVANVSGISVSQHYPLRSCINNVISLVGQRRKGEEFVPRQTSPICSLIGC